ncbi:hypothetical protein E0F15_17915 [Frankia sp. B2]|uniref:hypothetical protein n=1 Tax=unclassified Frankia TaxID=2632575 RepID=UPI0006CA54B9|nr:MULTISPECIES: hypothetical protein [unclassified Frankia]KPM51489.1 hypothetical protein ACG83_35945 [Frankia sp. R43]TFE26512.1 hypothetical protein E0F15_17915 [Frankia sp. B2]
MPTTSDTDRTTLPVVPAGRPATVWPCPPATPDQTSADWLPGAVERLVVTISRPDDPVLLLTEPPLPQPARPAEPDADERGERLADCAGTVARLGRRVQVRTAPGDTALRWTGSAYGPDLVTGRDPDPDRFLLVATVVEPTRLGWFTRIDWGGLLAVGGTLAVVSRADSLGGWLIDPTVELATAAGRGGLALLDRIVLLEIPLDRLNRPATPIPAGVVAQRVHSDLLLFSAVNPAVPPAWSAAR